MRTDALNSFFGGGRDNVQKRMDCIGPKQRKADTGFAMRNSVMREHGSFKKAMADVADNNVTAQKVTGKTVAKRSSKKTAESHGTEKKTSPEKDTERTQEEVLLEGLLELAGSMETIIPENIPCDQAAGDLQIVDKETALQAQEIVADALTDIAETLGLSIFPDLEKMSLTEVGSDVKEQFSEIVFVLKKLLQGFEWSKTTGVPVETPKTTIETGSIDAVTEVLQTSTFKIEMACRVLGIAEEVQQEVAVKLELTNATGIIQASDPSTIKMAAYQSEKLFGSMFTASTDEVSLATMVDRIKALLAEGGETDSPMISVNGTETTASKGDLQQFNASVYRALLKIDAVAKTTGENTEASGKIESLDLPKTAAGSLTLAQSIGEALAADGNTVEDGTSLLDMHIAGGQKFADVVGPEAKIPTSLLKMADETVMGQLTDRLQSVIRSGLSEIRIQLRPESLGQVQMRLQMEGDLLVAKIDVENQQVKEIMERNLPMLKDALAQQNITTGNFDIQVGSGLGRHQGGAEHPWEQGQTAHNENARQGQDEENSDRPDHHQRTHDDTGKRYGNNSVEYFA